MAQTPIHIGHIAPSNATETAIGSTVPSGHVWEARVWITNRTGTAKVFGLRHAYANAAAALDQWRAGPGANIAAGDVIILPSFPMSPTDGLYFTSDAAGGLTVHADALDIT